MITPNNITNYYRNQAELEEFLLFAIIVAGKTAKTQADKLNQFLTSAKVCDISPFDWIEKLICRSQDCGLMDCMKHYKLGQYNRLDKAFKGILQFKGNLDSVTLEELESVDGIGCKTSRFFILHSRPNQNLAVLDTHILKFLGSKGHKVPKATPSNKKQYRKLEEDFLFECELVGKTAADLDLEIWKSYAK